MPRDFSTEFIEGLNALESDDPEVTLYEIDLGDGTYERWTDHFEQLTYLGETYAPWGITRQDLQENSDGSLPRLQIRVDNVTRAAQAHFENVDLRGKDVAIRILLLSQIGSSSPQDVFETILQIVDAPEANRETLTIILGLPSLLDIPVPRIRISKHSCIYRAYKGIECSYPNDRFGADSRQDFLAVGDDEGEGGWVAMNTAAADVLDSDQTNAGDLTLTVQPGNLWDDAARAGPAIWKGIEDEFTGDFDVWLEIESLTQPAGAGGELLCGILVWDALALDDWLLVVVRRDTAGDYFVETRDTDGGSTTLTSRESQGATLKPFLRVARTANDFKIYSKATEAGAWGSALATVTRSDLGASAELRIGIAGWAVSTNAAETAIVRRIIWDAGGFPTCDRTLDGPMGCIVHRNTHRVGIATAILRR